jgi:ferredoxin
MRVKVIEGKCAGHARCAAVAPEIYKLNDEGFLETPEIIVPAGLEKQAVRGARACPERAIEVLDEGG